MSPLPAVLITGCSSGVGRAAALRFRSAGYPVYATARHPDTLADLAAAGAVTLGLDVTDEESMMAAVKRVEHDHGAVGILINNAAYGLQGAIETLSVDHIRHQFETNLFGLVRLTQLVLPGMRARGRGRVVNVSAMGAYFVLPGTGALHASKHAVRAVTDALRMELRPFGITVTAVEPGPIATPFSDKANTTIPAGSDSGPYARFHADLRARMSAAYQDRPGTFVLSPDRVARCIEKAALTPRPRVHYPVGVMCRFVIATRRLLPDAVVDAMVRRMFLTPRPS
ncbi:SDR family NAD(P)-dependent oxidoreductase [Micromonospora sp. HM5-17]|jgi:NAD(P)-dependent dehydrogenase (short-subunit alcohol dehydrogenase family)|uniref:SDR family NAD(P)-dependent oxidoreductase n=1 Tax=Micromonospora sp. HM5-17 TaxID=2487710 RepID=UPI000F487789|nr:SDR family NAD(P)-dependent oxidoreductase [Micromonospora sp. HM5-17]ROT26078.1 SDR family NAD(P)-dependent oxidoreductase [Micromonospora sp. HM5-17]